jgi:hypothetical protein
VARDRHPAVSPSPKAVWRSRDRGRKSHRILRRVLDDGRHPGSSRGVGFHETAFTVVLADLTNLRPAPTLSKEGRAASKQPARRCWRREGSESRDRGVRGSIGSAPWEENAHARSPGREAVELEISVRITIRRSGLGCRETPIPPVVPRGALDSAGCPRSESCESEPGTREVRVHAVRLGGRSRLDASRVFSTGRSQDLLVNQRGR